MEKDLASRRTEYHDARNVLSHEQMRISLFSKPTIKSKEFYKHITDNNDKKIELLDEEINKIIAIQEFTFTLYSKIYEVEYEPIIISGNADNLPDFSFKLFFDGIEEKNVIVYIENFCGCYLKFEWVDGEYIITNVKGEFKSPTNAANLRIITGDERGDEKIICPRCEKEIPGDSKTCQNEPVNNILVIDSEELTNDSGSIVLNNVKITYNGKSKNNIFVIQNENDGITFDKEIVAIGILMEDESMVEILYDSEEYKDHERRGNCEDLYTEDYNYILPGSSYVCLIPGYGEECKIKRIILAY